MATPTLDEAYGWCQALARRHYENFPVASLLLPRAMRRSVAVVYAFARTADDYADEGALPAAERRAALDDWGARLDSAARGDGGDHPVFIALADVLARHAIPPQLFRDLLDAFRQDVRQRRYPDDAEVLDYCRRSANPVGRILLHLNHSADEENLELSDRICTALQLINFWQDLAQDLEENDRIYLPQRELMQFGISEAQLRERRNSPALRALMEHQYRRSRALMLEGAPLGRRLRGRFGLEIRLIVAGGLRVLDRLEAQQDVFARPRLTRGDGLRMLWSAVGPFPGRGS